MNWIQFLHTVETALVRFEGDVVEAMIFMQSVGGEERPIKGVVVTIAGHPHGCQLCVDISRWAVLDISKATKLVDGVAAFSIDPDLERPDDWIDRLVRPKFPIVGEIVLHQETWPVHRREAG